MQSSKRNMEWRKIWIGTTKKILFTKIVLALYKTGRTNANDGGNRFCNEAARVDFLSSDRKPWDASKYFLGYRQGAALSQSTFVVKYRSKGIADCGRYKSPKLSPGYKIEAVVKRLYMEAIEEIINVEDLIAAFRRRSPIGKATGSYGRNSRSKSRRV